MTAILINKKICFFAITETKFMYETESHPISTLEAEKKAFNTLQISLNPLK